MKKKITTKIEVMMVCGRSVNCTYSLNLFLFNCILKEIVAWEDLNGEEKKSLNKILEGDNKRWVYDHKMKQIIERKGGDKNYSSI